MTDSNIPEQKLNMNISALADKSARDSMSFCLLHVPTLRRYQPALEQIEHFKDVRNHVAKNIQKAIDKAVNKSFGADSSEQPVQISEIADQIAMYSVALFLFEEEASHGNGRKINTIEYMNRMDAVKDALAGKIQNAIESKAYERVIESVEKMDVSKAQIDSGRYKYPSAFDNDDAPKVQLEFMVVPEYLTSHCEIVDPVKIKVVDPDAIFLTGILGESGRKMVQAGIPFLFTRRIAEKLIASGIAEKID